jgi:hypothetical protein
MHLVGYLYEDAQRCQVFWFVADRINSNVSKWAAVWSQSISSELQYSRSYASKCGVMSVALDRLLVMRDFLSSRLFAECEAVSSDD